MYGNEIIKNTSVRSNSPGHNNTFRLFHISTASSHLYKASFIHHITPHIPQFHHIFLQAILSYYRCCHHDERTITILHFTFPSYGHWLFKFNLILSRYLFMFMFYFRWIGFRGKTSCTPWRQNITGVPWTIVPFSWAMTLLQSLKFWHFILFYFAINLASF